MTGRALARVTGVSQSTVRRALTRLREAGLVEVEHVPPALLYRVNTDHLAMPALQALLRPEEQLRSRLVEQVASWLPPPESVLLFGSVARGQATVTSDVDVLVVRPDALEPDAALWQSQVAELSYHIGRWTGRPASVIEMSRLEAREGFASREPFLIEADRDGWLIAGHSLPELAAGA